MRLSEELDSEMKAKQSKGILRWHGANRVSHQALINYQAPENLPCSRFFPQFHVQALETSRVFTQVMAINEL